MSVPNKIRTNNTPGKAQRVPTSTWKLIRVIARRESRTPPVIVERAILMYDRSSKALTAGSEGNDTR